MKTRRSIALTSLISLLTVAGSAGLAFAESPSGTWRSDTGNTFIVPLVGRGQFDIIKVTPQNGKEVLRAAWVAGMEGTQFSYTTNSVRYTATFNANNPDRVNVAYNNTSNFWTRVKNTQFGWLGLLGTWRSTSGNTFTIAERGRTFNIIMTTPDGAKSVVEASWIEGMEGTQFAYKTAAGGRNVGTRMPRDENQIRIEASTGTVNNWSRVR